MALREELHYINPVETRSNEAVLSIIYTAQVMQKTAYTLFRPYGLTDSQFNVMMLLGYQSPPEGLPQSRLGQMLVVNKSNVTGLVDRLEENGFVERVDSPNDRRVKLVRLTEKGKAKLDETSEVYEGAINAAMADFSYMEKGSLLEMLERIRAALSDLETG
jgi:DNA-binding MarR family transcriptional regulator